ncbi:MAG: Gfo/Idh/MocA family oxidoreductase [Gemmatimonadetes bacterium]|nr:Gfo/Idh/MocA family oxidoreductase [Gemmatimonadota bacterium]MDA1102308.1 Gfo/Idh/MocA family oxidoreductase [Gemmatimonadota bacterium]
MAERRIRWGVISTANIGRAAVNPAIQASRNGRLDAVASRDGERAREFATAHSIPTWYGSYEALLDDPDIDAVYIPLPNSLHREWAVRAAEAGKHVLCEKPLALDAAECLDMEAAARANGVKLMEAFMYRFHPRTKRVVEMVRSGLIGDVKAIRTAFTFRLTRKDNIRLDPTLGGGALMDVGCYCVNVSRTIVGAEPVSVQAVAQWTERGVDEALAGMLHFPEGVVSHFDCSLTMERSEAFEVAGTDGYLRVPAAFLPGTGPVGIEEVRGREPVKTHTLEGTDEYLLMVEHFADCILLDVEPRYSASEAAANMRVIEALYRSARSGGVSVTL